MKFAIVAALSAVVACSASNATVDGGAGGAPAAGGGAGGAPTSGGAGGAPSDGGAAACRANAPLGASVSWVENGVAKCATTVVAQRSTVGADQTLQIQGVTLDGATAGMLIVAYGGALEGTHDCSLGTPDGALLGTPGTFYVDFVRPGTKQACSITITSGGVVGGANATGSFTATFTGTGGAVVTNGLFDTPVKGPPS